MTSPFNQAWNAIEKQKQINPNAELCLINEIQPENPTIIAFGTPPSSLQGQEALVSSSNLKEDKFDHFAFLCNKSNPKFSLNQAAIKLFQSHYRELLQLKEKLVDNSKSKTPSSILITGQSVGGSVATLFTLWLLQGLDLLRTKYPLCITFGSPLVGDEHLRQCVLRFPKWKSCFLHIVSDQDPTPQLFISQNSGTFKPFGIFLLCSASGNACFEDPDVILEQLVKTNSQNQECHYGQILADLKCDGVGNVSMSTKAESDALLASVITHFQAIGILSQQQPSTEIDRTEKHETMLTKIEAYITFFGWYMKDGKRRKTGYYDTYKNQWDPTSEENEEMEKLLRDYCEVLVIHQVKNNPQREGAHFRRLLLVGTRYRRTLEPLFIADYYKDGGKNYHTQEGNRPPVFIVLEEWLAEEDENEATASTSERETVGSSLNKDSLFWAHVEEALISCDMLKDEESSSEEKESSLQKLKKFEGYVLDALKNNSLSAEIFLEQSSFMQWWNKYQVIMGSYYSSPLTKLMKNDTYLLYNKGELNL